MAITDEARNRLYNTPREKLGAEDATTMMELLPPVGWADVATKRDLDHLAVLTKRDIDRLALAVERLGADIDREMNRRFEELPRLFATKDDLRAQTNRYIGWMVVGNATLVAAVSLITSLR